MDDAKTLHIYRRVSTDRQEEDGYGLELQLDAGKSVADQLGFGFKLWDEGAQSSTKEDLSNRPVLTNLLKEVTSGGIEHLYVYHENRLSRNRTAWYIIGSKLIDNGIKLYEGRNSVPRDLSKSEDAFVFDIMRSISVYEQDQRMSRLSAGKFQRVKQGKWHGGPTPFGYLIGDDGFLKKNSVEAKWVLHAFKRYIDGASVNEIKKDFFNAGLRTRRGKSEWSGASIRNMISEVNHYQGYYNYTHKDSGESEQVTCERIVPQSMFNKARKHFSMRSYNDVGRIKDTNIKYPTLLKDFLVCGHCGTKFGQRVYSYQYRNFYYCRSKEINWRILDDTKKLKCKDRLQSIKIDETDKLVTDAVIKVISESHIFKENIKSDIMKTQTFKMSSDQIIKSKRKIKKLHKDIRDVSDLIVREKAMKRLSKVARDDLNGTLSVWEEQKDIWVTELDVEENKLLNTESSKNWVDWVAEFDTKMNRLRDEDLSLDERKIFINQVVERIEVFNADTTEHELKIRFKLPYVADRLEWKFDRKGNRDGYDIFDGTKEIMLKSDISEKKKLIITTS